MTVLHCKAMPLCGAQRFILDEWTLSSFIEPHRSVSNIYNLPSLTSNQDITLVANANMRLLRLKRIFLVK